MTQSGVVFRALSAASMAFFLVSCASGPDGRYLGSSELANLVLPPDLVQERESSSFELPAAFVTPSDGNRNQVPVLASLQSARLEGNADFYWLTVDLPVEQVYPLVKQFWGSEGYSLAEDEPATGMMTTDWIFTEVGTNKTDKNWFLQLFSGNDYAAIQDQFHTRIERAGEDGQGSRIYIAHRGTENQQVSRASAVEDVRTATDVEWFFRQPEPELELEKLSRLLVFLGLEQSDVADKIETARLFSPRVTRLFDAEEQVYYLLMDDPLPIAWNRVYHTLQRYDYVIEDVVRPAALVDQPGILIRDSIIRVQSNVDEEAGFFSFFGSGQPDKETVIINISEVDNSSSRLVVDTTQNSTKSNAATEELLAFLYRTLK